MLAELSLAITCCKLFQGYRSWYKAQPTNSHIGFPKSKKKYGHDLIFAGLNILLPTQRTRSVWLLVVMTKEEKVQLAALNKRVFEGEELTGQLKELHDHLKAKDRAILPAPGNYLILCISFSHLHRIFYISVFYCF